MIAALTDAYGSFSRFQSAFPTATLPLARRARQMHPHLFRGESWVLPFRSFLIRLGRTTALVDAGLGPPPTRLLPACQGWLPGRLEQLGLAPADIEFVLLTYFHVDHIGWTVDDEGNPFFRRATYFASEAEWSFIEVGGGEAEVLAARILPLERRRVLRLVQGETELCAGISVFPTPGHTPGHLSVEVASAGRRAVIMGDVCVHPAQMIDPALAYAHEVDPVRAWHTREALLETLANEQTLVAAGHFPGGGLGVVDKRGSAYRWRAVGDTNSR